MAIILASYGPRGKCLDSRRSITDKIGLTGEVQYGDPTCPVNAAKFDIFTTYNGQPCRVLQIIAMQTSNSRHPA
jgi:hypothetical protein